MGLSELYHASSSPLRLKTCTKCGNELPATPEFFVRRAAVKSGLGPECKSCRSAGGRLYQAAHREENAAYLSAYRASHREEARAWCRAYQTEHPEAIAGYKHKYYLTHRESFRARDQKRRALKMGNGGAYTGDDIKIQYERQAGKCFYCHKEVGQDYHADHVTPLVLGGSNGPENIVIACPHCNQSKNAKHPMDFCGRLL